MAYPIWQATITDDNGNVLPGAEITVVNEETGLNATLYSTRNGTSKTNPFFATVDGFAQFYAAPGLYRITATDGGTGTTQTFRYVRLVEVATTAEAIAGTAGVLTDAAGVHSAFKQFGLGIGSNPSAISRFWSEAPGSGGSRPEPGGFGFVTLGGGIGFLGADLAIKQSFDEGSPAPFGMFGRNYGDTGLPAAWVEFRHTGNTTVDGNGFIKVASPIVNLFADHIEANDSLEVAGAEFERVSTGHYRLTGVPELSREGWYIETPKDRNGNIYFTLDYVESPGTLDIYTYTPDYSSGRAENGAPVDIVEGRFVSLRFAELPAADPVEE